MPLLTVSFYPCYFGQPRRSLNGIKNLLTGTKHKYTRKLVDLLKVLNTEYRGEKPMPWLRDRLCSCHGMIATDTCVARIFDWRGPSAGLITGLGEGSKGNFEYLSTLRCIVVQQLASF